jgi:hypothetical protein
LKKKMVRKLRMKGASKFKKFNTRAGPGVSVKQALFNAAKAIQAAYRGVSGRKKAAKARRNPSKGYRSYMAKNRGIMLY